jgi:MoaA/NifB/PqqE/SkfB family radical SAM enzyme
MGKGPSRKFHNRLNDAYVEGTLTCLRPDVITQRIHTDFPLVLNVEPSNACNLRCTVCPRRETVRRHGTHYLSLSAFKSIADQASENGPLIMLNLHKDGEPLMHRQLPEMVAYAKGKSVARTIHLNTNGTLLHMPIAERLLDAGIDDITISVDAALTETYFRIKQDHDLDGLNRNIEAFMSLRDRMNVHTFVRVKIMEFDWVSAEEIAAFHRRWEGVADQVQVTGAHDWSGAIADLAITDEISDVRYPCALLWYTLAINSNGKVSICNVDWDYSGVVGDINKASIHEIWNGWPLRRIRRAHLQQQWDVVPVCESCVLWVSVGDMTEHFRARPEFHADEPQAACMETI